MNVCAYPHKACRWVCLEMKPGSKWKLYVPSKLAYGEQGAGNAIPPDTPFIFEVELPEVVQ